MLDQVRYGEEALAWEILSRPFGTNRHLLGKFPLSAFVYPKLNALMCASAEKWNYNKAIDRLERSLVWRRAMGLYDVQGMAESLQKEVSQVRLAFIPFDI
jgi:hypothetical protein